MASLLAYASNTYSQSGEDGIIAHILGKIGRDHWCVEFGAWDGIHLSNTYALIEQGYSAVLIESDPEKFVELQKNMGGYRRVRTLNARVGWDSHRLDSILPLYDIPDNFDFLSIDIDGNDYWAWDAIIQYRPKLVCIEFNPTICTEVDYVQPANPEVRIGASLAALTRLGKTKGYELVCVLPWNAFFVERAYYPRFRIEDNSPHALRTDNSLVTYFFFGYDGSKHLVGAQRCPWAPGSIK